jgi:arylsulfatase A-like enzyme
MGLPIHLLLLVSGVLSAGQTDATKSNLVPASLAQHQHDLVLITVDALRADRLGTYGYARPTSPHMDALARESTVFQRAYCSGPTTSFSIASIMLGRHAWGTAQESHLARYPTLADRFSQAGYQTIALYPPAVYFSSGPEFEPLRERHFGFAKVVHDTPEGDDAIARTEAAIRLLQEHAGDPVFLWVHYFGPHEPYEVHPSSDFPVGPNPSAAQRYDGEVAWVDRQIGRLVDHVRATRPGAIIVLTADHGEEFGEHGGAYHGTSLFDEQLRVPLLIAAPGLPARREHRPVSTVDVGAMVESLFDAHSLAAGSTLSPTPSLPIPESPVFAELGALKAVVVGPYKAICDFWAASCRLYNTDRDPGERLNLAARKPRTLATMRRLIHAWAAQDPASDTPAPWLLSRRESELDTRLEAARFLSRVAQPRQRAALRRAWSLADPPVESWLAVVLAGLGDKQARRRVADLDLAIAPAHPEFIVQRAMALAGTGHPQTVAAIAEALARTTDADFRCRLFGAVAQLPGDEPRRLLLPAYDDVRTRRCVSAALERRGDPQTADFVAAKLETEPYATVRAILIRTLARVGGARYRDRIKRIWASDPEPLVSAAARSALRALGAAEMAAKARRRAADRAAPL